MKSCQLCLNLPITAEKMSMEIGDVDFMKYGVFCAVLFDDVSLLRHFLSEGKDCCSIDIFRVEYKSTLGELEVTASGDEVTEDSSDSIEVRELEIQPRTVEIFDVNGRILSSSTSVNAGTVLSLATDKLSDGLYTVRLQNGIDSYTQKMSVIR